jgi:lipoprotein signal peptidase
MSSVLANFRSPAALARFFLVMLVGLVVDLGTKYWAYATLVESTYVSSTGRVYGYVRDMIFGLPGWTWPGEWTIGFLNYPSGPERLVFPWIFNIADMLLCTGVCFMIVYSLFQQNPKPTSVDQNSAEKEGKLATDEHR